MVVIGLSSPPTIPPGCVLSTTRGVLPTTGGVLPTTGGVLPSRWPPTHGHRAAANDSPALLAQVRDEHDAGFKSALVTCCWTSVGDGQQGKRLVL